MGVYLHLFPSWPHDSSQITVAWSYHFICFKVIVHGFIGVLNQNSKPILNYIIMLYLLYTYIYIHAAVHVVTFPPF